MAQKPPSRGMPTPVPTPKLPSIMASSAFNFSATGQASALGKDRDRERLAMTSAGGSSVNGGVSATTPSASAGLGTESGTNPTDGTFLTRSRAGGGEAIVTLDPLGMDRVRQLHGQLTGVVGALNDKVSSVLKKQESEFLRAYRAHMYSVQKELAQLRAKADDAALQLAKNEKIRQLEAERDWYRSEALRLDSFCSSLKTDVEYMRDKLAAVEDDRAWLERQLKTSKRSTTLGETDASRIPIAPLSRSGVVGNGTGGVGGSGEYGGEEDVDIDEESEGEESRRALAVVQGSRSGLVVPKPPPRTEEQRLQAAAAGTSTGSGSGPKLTLTRRMPLPPAGVPEGVRSLGRSLEAAHSSSVVGRGEIGIGLASSSSGNTLQASGAVVPGAPSPALLRQVQNQLTAAQRMVDTLRARNSRLKAANSALRSSRGELETFFLQCVEDVRKEVARRRVRTVASTSAATSLQLAGMGGGGGSMALSASAASMAEAALSNANSVDLAVALARARNATISDFTPGDRRAVVARLLQDEYVLQGLHEVIFGEHSGTGLGSSEHYASNASLSLRERGEGGSPDADSSSLAGHRSPSTGRLMPPALSNQVDTDADTGGGGRSPPRGRMGVKGALVALTPRSAARVASGW